MSPYAAIVSARLRTLLQYRAAAGAGIVTRIFWGLIRVMIFEGFYRSALSPQPMRLEEVITYVWLGQATLGLILWSVDAEVRSLVRTGGVAHELLKPLDLYGLWFARGLAARAAPTLMQAGPVLLFAALFFGFSPPPSPGAGAAVAAASAAALLLSTALSTLVTITLLWTVSGEGVARVVPPLAVALSGLLVPIPLFPPAARAVLEFLPFRGLIDTPFRIYMGHLPAAGSLPGILHQLAWTAVLVLFGRWLLARGLRRMVVQGG